MRENVTLSGQGASPEKIVEALKEALGGLITDIETRKITGGSSVRGYNEIWGTIPRESLLDAIREISLFDAPHHHVYSTDDIGDKVVLNYHLSLFRGAGPAEQVRIHLRVYIPKDDLKVDSLSELIPGVEYSEREMREMMGISFIGQPVEERVFLFDGHPDGVFPWRKDSSAPGPDIVRELE